MSASSRGIGNALWGLANLACCFSVGIVWVRLFNAFLAGGLLVAALHDFFDPRQP